ncbi:MAG: FecR domain-containing protein [Candidatus Omnitrophica bacterium]|nr:FecR domain-containing protein [Candidatus Omnitrophota bacterium]
MNNKENRVNSEDALIRSALNNMDASANRERMKRAFVSRARKRFPKARRDGEYWFSRMAAGVAVCYAVLAGIYLWMTFASSAIDGFRGEKSRSWRNYYQAASGKLIPYNQGDELRLIDGSTIVCLKDSTVGVVYTLKERLIAFHRGAIEIQAAHKNTLPLIVTSGTAEIRVTGTRFIVSTDEPYGNWEEGS